MSVSSEKNWTAFLKEAVWPREGGRYEQASREGWEGAVEACAREVEAAGCLCLHILTLGGFRGTVEHGQVIVDHDPRCPVALAAKLRRLAS